MAISLKQIELLMPLAIQWAAEEEAKALKLGEPLTQIENDYAEKIGVRFPEKVRLLKVSAMPSPRDPILKRAADQMGSTLAQADGLSLGYAIFIRQNCWRQLRLIVHELAHTRQYERGGLALLREFVLEYPDYPNGPLEQEAISTERRFFCPARSPTMLKVIELAFCCYAVTDMKRARAFYEGVLNLKPTTVTDSGHNQWVEYEFGPYALAIGCAPGMFKPSPDGCSAALEVEDFDAAMIQLRENDVKFRLEPMDCPSCRMAMIFDPDGNTICIHKRHAK